jgi:hypothetical protein
MIKFEPDLIPIANTTNPEMITIRNSSVYEHATELQNKYSDVICKSHPDKESKILVRLRDDEDFLEIQSWCCNDFKSQLYEIIRQETQGSQETL